MTERPAPRLSDFDFDLPEERIALAPARPRDSARLLHVTAEELSDRIVRDLPEILRPGDLLVMNDTAVIPAQLEARRAPRADEGGERPVGPVRVGPKIDLTLAKRLGPNVWEAFARPAKRLKEGDRLTVGGSLQAQMCGHRGDGLVVLAFELEGPALDAAVARLGAPPLPPYIARKRAASERDRDDYQTVYASRPGAVAAPTAGLHFTPELLERLSDRGIGQAMVTLHVGAGTFLPVKSEDLAAHKMHAEWGEIDAATAARINRTRREGGRIVSVGTTSLRILESAAGEDGRLAPFTGETAIFISPGYRFRLVDCLMTNFHLPRSTLVMLVAAFSGLERIKAAYAHAVEAGYRFYSYGDACFLERAER